MKLHWTYLASAALLAALFLLTNGVPLIPVLAGIAGATLLTLKKARRSM